MFWLIVAVLAIANTAVGWAIGVSRKRPIDGAVVGFILGPIGWLLMLFLFADERPRCPACGGVVNEGYAKCRHCGSVQLR